VAGSGVRVSMVFEQARLFESLSAVQNVRLIVGNVRSEAEVRAALATILPPESLDKPVSELSGGMRRRLELCRALLAPSDLLLLDEPLTGLDDQSRAAAIELLLAMLQGRTLLISSHDSRDGDDLGAEVIYL
jgi:ABC-type multidrug transport system ATPase subunit